MYGQHHALVLQLLKRPPVLLPGLHIIMLINPRICSLPRTSTGARVACPLTSTTITLTLVVDRDSVREVVAEICVVLLRQSLSCDNYGQCKGEAEACSSIQHTLECLLYVDRLFGTSLKVWNTAF